MGARNRDAAVAASWQQHRFSLSAQRRSAGTAAAARSCGVAAATAAMCAAVVTHRVARTPTHFQRVQGEKLYTAWVVRSADRQSMSPHIA